MIAVTAVAALAGCSRTSGPTSYGEVLSGLPKAGVDCVSGGSTPTAATSGKISEIRCKDLRVIWWSDSSGEAESISDFLCKARKLGGSDAKLDAEFANTVLVYGTNYMIGPWSGKDWGSINPQDVSRAIPDSKVATYAEFFGSC